MKSYTLKYETFIPTTLDQAWDFFTSPLNLVKITPPDMNFVVTSEYNDKDKVYPGMIITYFVSPLFGIKLRWMTEITHVKEKEYFVDEQRFGPYALWHHQHHFKQVEGGIMMTDIVNYAIPYGFIGRIANSLFVKKKLKNVFSFREATIGILFGATSASK
ncbi:SRPBCC family protein [Mucilaginibacter sp. BT774]|uniref:SRPBCC family protein n=1 Tax=Mucilaginibacter sp. BT774 TaxID=3062276 RepID=UPI00267618C5|nr:SRPBCC family protein [Mucilaginibacter sp. BT774]MDO3626612.1 SRPBCC family protein [Mucilaginibacter sp. BT774]